MRAQSHTKRTHKCKSYCFGVLAGPVGSEQREWGASPQTPRQQPDRNFPRLSASPPGAGAGPGPSITHGGQMWPGAASKQLCRG